MSDTVPLPVTETAPEPPADGVASRPAGLVRQILGGILLLGALPLLFAGALILADAGSLYLEHMEASSWPTIEARIEKSGLERDGRTQLAPRRATARYSYEVDGRRYVGRRIGLREDADRFGTWQVDMQLALDRARRRQEALPVHVDPANPARAILNPDLRPGLFGLTVAGGALVVGMGVVLLLMAIRRLRD